MTEHDLHRSPPSHLRVAGLSFELDADPVAAHAIEPALAHLLTTEPLPSTARPWRAWESEQPHSRWVPDPTGPGRLAGGGLVVARPEPPVVEVARPDGAIELWGAPGALNSGDVRAHPASTALAHALAARGAIVLHAAAVTWNGRAALILGPSGAGKSTAALTCVAAGAGYLGDDLCILVPGAWPEVHSLYATAKLTSESERALGGAPGPTLGTTPRGKRVIAMQTVATAAPLAALIVLGSPDSAPAGAAPLPPRLVARALTATGLKASLGAGSLAEWLHTTADLARRVPTFAVSRTWDLSALAADVERALARGCEIGLGEPG